MLEIYLEIPVTTGWFELRISCIRSSYLTHYPHVVTGICDPNKSRSQHHCSVKLGSKLKYLNAMLTIYKSFVRPHLDYGDIIYDQRQNESFCNKLESIQYNAALAITGAI